MTRFTMYKKLCMAALAAVSALSKKCVIHELGENGFEVEEMQSATETIYATLLSFYHPNKKSLKYADSLMQGACDIIEENMELGVWPKREI